MRVVLQRLVEKVSIRRADYWLVEEYMMKVALADVIVSIRRADYWLVEAGYATANPAGSTKVSIRRADYWLVEVPRP